MTSKLNDKLHAGLHWIVIICLALSLGFAMPVLAQEAEEGDQQEAATEQADQQKEESAEADAEKEKRPSVGRSSSETFVPSEGISEDLSVSFPVDI